MGLNIGQTLRQWATRDPSRLALVDRAGQRRAFTYGDLDLGARRFARTLRDGGVSPGDRVALIAENGPSFVMAFMGASYAGAAVVPVPILSPVPEIRFRISHSGCRLIAHDAARSEVASAACASMATEPLSIDSGVERDDEPTDSPEDLTPDAVAMILYTSGTTGDPKGACITHASLLTHTAAIVHHTLRMDDRTNVLGVLPLSHSFGVRMAVLAPFYAGGRVLTMPRFDPARSLEAAREEGVTWIPAVPTMFAAWAGVPRSPGTLPWQELEWCLSAGAPLPEEIRLRAMDRLGAPILQGYGLTEATFTAIDAPSSASRSGSVGRPVWGVEVSIADTQGAEVSTGTAGEVRVRGQNVMAGYLDAPGSTAEVMKNGWLHTGDIGFLDADGALTIVDRKKDLILRGGNNVYPSEVERVLHRHPDVAEAAVVGVPDSHYGERVVAVIRLRAGAALDTLSLDRLCRAELSPHKVPRAYAPIDEMPLGPSEKVLKRVLRERLRNGSLSTLEG